MHIRFAALAATLLAGMAPAQPPADPAAPPPVAAPVPVPAAPAPRTQSVLLLTGAGPIRLAIEVERAPVTAANFLRYVDGHRLDGISFYRATKVADGFGLIQGGVRNDPKRVLPPIAHEPTSRTGLTHADGTISMARAAPGSANGDFFITIGAMPTMDAGPTAGGDLLGFAAFGHVTEGMDVVRRILDMPISPTAGDGPLKGQMLADPVKILSAKRD